MKTFIEIIKENAKKTFGKEYVDKDMKPLIEDKDIKFIFDSAEEYASQFKLPPVSNEKKQEIIDCLNTAILDEMEDDDFVEYFNREIIPIIVPALIKRFSFGDWIDVKEKLPDNNQSVLFLPIKYNTTEPDYEDMRKGAFYFSDQWKRKNMFCDGAYFGSDKVTHWMPLPIKPTSPKK